MFSTRPRLGASMILVCAAFLATPASAAGVAGPAPGAALAAPAPKLPAAAVDDLNAALLQVMQNGRKLGFKGRYDLLLQVVRRVYDVPVMTAIAVGAGWSGLAPDQQKQLEEAFARYVAATYAQQFNSYSGEKFVDQGTRPLGANVVVDTTLVPPDGSPVKLDYVTRRADGGWKIVDVFLTGTISQLATRRSEFSAVFQRSGFKGLLETLEEKVAQIENSARVG